MHEVKTNFWQYCFGLDRCYIVWPLVNSAVAPYSLCDGNFPNKIACFSPFALFPVVSFGQKKSGWIFHDQQTRSIRIYFISKWMFIWCIRRGYHKMGMAFPLKAFAPATRGFAIFISPFFSVDAQNTIPKWIPYSGRAVDGFYSQYFIYEHICVCKAFLRVSLVGLRSSNESFFFKLKLFNELIILA